MSPIGIDRATAAVGVSFGGLQAIHTAVSAPELAPKLILHSCAPSTLRYPDTWLERVAAPLIFGPAIQKMTWAVIHRLVASDRGLKTMMKSLTRLPEEHWLPQMSQMDRTAARATFNAMDSGYGFINDLRQASHRLRSYRSYIQTLVAAPTLIIASRHDGRVSLQLAENFAEPSRMPTCTRPSLPRTSTGSARAKLRSPTP